MRLLGKSKYNDVINYQSQYCIKGLIRNLTWLNVYFLIITLNNLTLQRDFYAQLKSKNTFKEET